MAKKPKRDEMIEVRRSKKGPWRPAHVVDRGFAPGEFQYMTPGDTRFSWSLKVADEGKTWRRYVDLNKPVKDFKFVMHHGDMRTTINDVPITIEVQWQRYVAHVTQDRNKFAADFPEDAAIGAYAAYVTLQRRKPCAIL